MNKAITVCMALLLVACSPAPEPAAPAEEAAPPAAAEMRSLGDILAAQPDEVQARYQYRHPEETMQFFGVTPGMTVIEALPGRGWYSKVLLPYLGSDGTL